MRTGGYGRELVTETSVFWLCDLINGHDPTNTEVPWLSGHGEPAVRHTMVTVCRRITRQVHVQQSGRHHHRSSEGVWRM